MITLTGTNKRRIRINVNHIVTYEQRIKDRSSEKYTYILLLGGNGVNRSVMETPEEIDQLIEKVMT
tara:strand:- start:3504 stop:3701 length:198 start_codon:yes stop_codon:yes gene_type:complete